MMPRQVLVLAAASILACGSPDARDPERPRDRAEGPAAPSEGQGDADPAEAAPSVDGRAATSARVDQRLLDAHNRYREQHCAPPLAWSDHLAGVAAQWADELYARGCPLEHSRHRYGENLAAGTPGTLDAERVVELWYEEIELYDFEQPGFSMEIGHFTQVVWLGTRELGCAQARCDGLDLWVCNYAPAGNVIDAFGQNVLPTTCDTR